MVRLYEREKLYQLLLYNNTELGTIHTDQVLVTSLISEVICL